MPLERSWRAPRLYDSVVSIGSQCITSMLLRAADLKRYSGPFDWIFSNLRMVCDCVEDDFGAFLDRQHITTLPPDRRPTLDTCFADHKFYQHRYGLNSIFNHYDPTSAEGSAYLERCVARFRSALNSSRPHLMLAVCERHQGGSLAFNRLCDLMEGHPAIDVLVLISPKARSEQGLELWEERGRHRLIYLHTSSHIAGIHFEAAEDNQFAVRTLRELVELNV